MILPHKPALACPPAGLLVQVGVCVRDADCLPFWRTRLQVCNSSLDVKASICLPERACLPLGCHCPTRACPTSTGGTNIPARFSRAPTLHTCVPVCLQLIAHKVLAPMAVGWPTGPHRARMHSQAEGMQVCEVISKYARQATQRFLA